MIAFHRIDALVVGFIASGMDGKVEGKVKGLEAVLEHVRESDDDW